MQHIIQKNCITDALRLAEQDLTQAIDVVRSKARRGEEPTARKYLRLVREVFEMQEKAKDLGATGPLVEPMMPIPFSQFVGLSADQIFAANWRIDRHIFPAAIVLPLRRAA